MAMRRAITLLISVLLCITLVAQEKNRHNFEVGIGINMGNILGAVGGPGRGLGPGTYFEYRYNLTDKFDIGGQLNYKYSKGSSAYLVDRPTIGLVYNQVGLKAVADYTGRPNKLVRPYIGVGIGGTMMFTNRTTGTNSTEVFGIVGPRLGLQIWKFRIALEFDFAFNGQYGFQSTESVGALNLSFTF